jgi:hypothetical protein
VDEGVCLWLTEDEEFPEELDCASQAFDARGSCEEEVQGDHTVNEVSGHKGSSDEAIHWLALTFSLDEYIVRDVHQICREAWGQVPQEVGC